MKPSSGHCYNCGYLFRKQERYCPRCGQKNRRVAVGLGQLLDDFAKDYFTFDSKLFRSLVPFLLKPGFLTREFILGRRVRYIPPLRLYVFVSFVYFLFLSFQTTPQVVSASQEIARGMAAADTLADSLRVAAGEGSRDLRTEWLGDSATQPFIIFAPPHRVGGDSATRPKAVPDTLGVAPNPLEDSLHVVIGGSDMNLRMEWLRDPATQPEAVLDTLGVASNPLSRRLVAQGLKLVRQSPAELFRYVIDHLSVTMFLIIPVGALLLKLFYWRRLYIEHLVFVLHLQAFAFVLLLLTQLLIDVGRGFEGWAVLAGGLYTWGALRRVYGQGRLRTSFKFFGLAVGYTFVLSFFLLGLIAVSFVLF